MEHKCDGCKYKGEHQEMMFKPMGVCLKEHNLIEAVKAYNAEKCPFTVTRQGEWISVDERLPDIDPHGKGRYGGPRSVRVLCACKQKGGKTFVKEGYYEPCGNGRVFWRIPGSIDAVTHWMPLPEPPKVKGGAE